MDRRISRAVALAAVALVPLLAGCGSRSGSAGSPAAPAGTPAPVSSSVPGEAASAAESSASPSSTVGTPAQTERVQAATEKFVKTVLTIGYPDKSFGDYTDRIKPLMTKDGFDALESADSTKKGSAALTSLYAQHARSAPKFGRDPEVTALEGGSATAQLDYENVAQRQDGGDWKTLKSLGTGTVTVTLVNDGGKWLVENAS
jgi:hypothetical protein